MPRVSFLRLRCFRRSSTTLPSDATLPPGIAVGVPSVRPQALEHRHQNHVKSIYGRNRAEREEWAFQERELVKQVQAGQLQIEQLKQKAKEAAQSSPWW